METKKTALHDQHVASGAKMVPFAGFVMPIQYSGILDETLAVRRNVGVFDVSHMGEFEFRGADAEKFLNRMTTNNVAKLEVGQVQYSSMLYDDGGMVDDLLVYRFEDRYVMVVNASNIDKDYRWLEEHLDGDVELKDISDRTTLLAIQGPRAIELVRGITDTPLDEMAYYHFREDEAGGVPAWISRTGYTGEDGFEIYACRDDSERLWEVVWEAGRPLGLKPVGLGARDLLRLEASYCLYGNDIDQTTNPIEAGLSWIVKTKKKGGFIGLEPVLKARGKPHRRLVGFVLNGKGIARHSADIFHDTGKVGQVTSGGYSPTLDKSIGLGYIDKPYDETGTVIEVDLRGRRIPAEVIQTPFYRRE